MTSRAGEPAAGPRTQEPETPRVATPETPESPARAAVRRQLQNLADYYADMLFIRDEAVHYQSVLERYFPTLNWDRLLGLYGDSPDDWPYIIDNYMNLLTPEELEPPDPPAVKGPRPPLRCIGQSRDMLSGELRPVYNRDPEPGEARPAPESTAAAA